MKTSDSSCRAEPPDSFFFVEVSDLVASAIGGGALVAVVADASAFGTSSLAIAATTTTAKELPSGSSIAKGKGIAVAIGQDPLANVDVFGVGDKVVEHTQVHYFKNRDLTVAKGFVIAIDHP